MLLNLIRSFYRQYIAKKVAVTHTDILERAIVDSGLSKDELRKCFYTLAMKTQFVRRGKNTRLSHLLVHDFGKHLKKEHRASLCFIMDEITSVIPVYRKELSPFNIYCILGKYLNAF